MTGLARIPKPGTVATTPEERIRRGLPACGARCGSAATDPRGGIWTCTEPAGHDGDHIAGSYGRAVRTWRACAADWPVCPEHGNTIRSSGGRAWCRVCGQVVLDGRCLLPASHWVQQRQRGGIMRISCCDRHTEDAMRRITGDPARELEVPVCFALHDPAAWQGDYAPRGGS